MDWRKELARKYGGLSGKSNGRPRHTPGVMNATEARFANQLTLKVAAGEIMNLEFEGVKFRIADRCWYTPDFVVFLPFNGGVEVYEVKGHWEDDARVKIKAAAARYPTIKFIAVTWNRRQKTWEFEEIRSR